MATTIPLFPLGAVLFPGLLLPLHIFEERYRLLVDHLLDIPADEPRLFGVIAIREGQEVGATQPTLYDIGCAAELKAFERHPDGRFDLVSTGTRRFRLITIDGSGPYSRAEIEWIDEPEGVPTELLAREVTAAFLSYRSTLLATQGQQDDGEGLPEDHTVLSYLIGAAMVLDLADQQAILEAPTTSDRLALESDLLRREGNLLQVLPSLPGVEYPRQPYSAN